MNLGLSRFFYEKYWYLQTNIYKKTRLLVFCRIVSSKKKKKNPAVEASSKKKKNPAVEALSVFAVQ